MTIHQPTNKKKKILTKMIGVFFGRRINKI